MKCPSVLKGKNQCGEGIESARSITVNSCSGIFLNNLESAVHLFPNPVKSGLTIKMDGKEPQVKLTLSDASETVIYSEIFNNVRPFLVKQLDLSGLSKGVYFLKLSNENRSFTDRIIVQ